MISLAYYRPPQPGQSTGTFPSVNMLADSTEGLTQSGQLRFDVPDLLGPIPDGEWKDVRAPSTLYCWGSNSDGELGLGASAAKQLRTARIVSRR